nr:unnamed protein product [Naegleria fowleri]
MKLGELSLLDHHQIHNHDRILETSTSSSSSTRPLLFVCGKNEYCQLLLCSSSSSSSEVISCFTTPQLSDPMLEKVIDDLVEIANGDRHTLFLTKSGQVFGIGSNQQGQLVNNTHIVSNLTKISCEDDVKFTNIICGSFHSMLLGDNGAIYVTGDSSFHQLGIYPRENVAEFTKLDFPEQNVHVSLIATSYSHSLCYCENTNKLFGMGSVFEDIYGDAYCTPQRLPIFYNLNVTLKTIQAGYRYTLFLTSENDVYLHGKLTRQLYAQPIKISIQNVKNIFTGGNHYFIETFDSKFYGSGLNDDKQIPFFTGTETIAPVELIGPKEVSSFHITSMAAGSYHTGVVTSCGMIYMCGWNELGQLGIPKSTSFNVECTPLDLDMSVQLDISRGTTIVKIFMSPSADNTFLLLRRAKEKLQFFDRLFQKIQKNFSDLAIHTMTS